LIKELINENYTYWHDDHAPYLASGTKIGKFCCIGGFLRCLGDSEHHTEFLSAYPFGERLQGSKCDALKHVKWVGGPSIGNDVWIGEYVTILGGIKIGDGVVIGAHSVVARDIPSYAVVVGNPASVYRYRFCESTIRMLKEIRWWNWPIEYIKEAASLLMGDENNIVKLYNFAVDNKLIGLEDYV
jgi:acetyltransferase-like isoleucine patch superfamily enzyme